MSAHGSRRVPAHEDGVQMSVIEAHVDLCSFTDRVAMLDQGLHRCQGTRHLQSIRVCEVGDMRRGGEASNRQRLSVDFTDTTKIENSESAIPCNQPVAAAWDEDLRNVMI